MIRPVVLIESPYSGRGVEAIRYLACCLLDSILRGECPIASHALYPLALPEREPGDAPEWPRNDAGEPLTGRAIGKDCHKALTFLETEIDINKLIDVRQIAYVDLGETEGMRWNSSRIEQRTLQGHARQIWESGKWPSRARWASTNETEGGAP